MRLKQLGRDFVTLGSGHVAAKAVAFGSTLVLARYLSVTHLAWYAVLSTALGYMQAISNWGTDAIGIRAAATDAGASASNARQVARFRLGTAALVMIAAIGVGSSKGLSWVTLLALCCCLLALAFRRDWLLLGLGSMGKVSAALASRELVFLAFVLVAVSRLRSLEAAICGIAVAEIAWTVMTILLSRRSRTATIPSERLSYGTLFLQGLPIVVVSVTVLTNNKIDVPLLSYFRSEGEVASYWAAYNILFAAMAAAALLTRAALPEMSRQARHSIEEGSGGTFRVAVLSGIAGCVASLGLALMARPIMEVAYSHRLTDGVPALQILALALPGHFLGAVLVGRLVAERRQQRWTIAAVSAAALNLGLNLMFIRTHGAIAAAWATVGSEWLLFLVVLAAFRSHRLHRALVLNTIAVVGCFVLGGWALIGAVEQGSWGRVAGIGVLLGSAFTLMALQRVPSAMRLGMPLSRT